MAPRGPLRISYPASIEAQIRFARDHALDDARAVAAQLGLQAVPPLGYYAWICVVTLEGPRDLAVVAY